MLRLPSGGLARLVSRWGCLRRIGVPLIVEPVLRQPRPLLCPPQLESKCLLVEQTLALEGKALDET